MKKRLLFIMCLIAVLMLLTACQSSEPQQFQVVTNPEQLDFSQGASNPTSVPVVVSNDWDTYDPSSEENYDPYEEEAGTEDFQWETAAPQDEYRYAGATPVLIDPIDKPTPTPAPALNISSYQVYDATNIGISFEGPVGWESRNSESSAYTILNPDASMDYPASLTIHKVSVSSTYTQADLEKQVMEMVSAIKPNYRKFSNTKTATRNLLDKNGVYCDFSGVEATTGANVWGRVHAVCVNKTLYIMEMYTPQVYKEQYKDTLYSRFRRTVKITK